MSWYNPFTWSATTGGIDLEAEARRTEALRAQEAEIDARRRASGRYDEQYWATADEQHVMESAAYDPAQYQAEVTDAAREGALEGLDAMQRGVKDTLSGAAGFSLRAVFGFVPWWLWLLAGAGLFFYLGGGGIIRRQIARHT